MWRFAALFLLPVPLVFAQFQVGVKLGTPLTDLMHVTASSGANDANVSDAYVSPTKRLLIGPTVRVGLPFGFGVQFDALYERVNYGHTFVFNKATISETLSSNTANRWQFPLLLQYRLKLPVVKPFVEAGPSFSHIAGGHNVTLNQDNTFGGFQGRTSSSNNLRELKHDTVGGFTAGLGVDIHVPFLHVAPEFRYTRWASAQFDAVSEFAALDVNYASLRLIGLTF
jgi:hypothetical protein